MDNALAQEYLRELEVVRKLSSHTLEAYAHDLALLIERLEGDKLKLQNLSADQARVFVARLHSSGRSPRSIARTLSAWRGFYTWLAEHKKLLQHNPLDDVKAPKRAKNLPKALSVENAMSLVESAAKEEFVADDFLRACDKAMIELLYSSGLRLSELLGIDHIPVQKDGYQSAGWIDMQSQEVMVLGKGGKRRTVPVGSMAAQAIVEWLEQRRRFAKDTEPALFINKQGKRLSPRTVQKHLQQLAQKAGLPTHVHPHMLRHSFASHVLQSSGDLRAVQEMLGHASIASTQIYTALDFQHLAQAYDKAHPRAKAKKNPS